MIFYFTGTGNSLFAAKRLLNAEESLINIADAIKNNQYEYNIADEENVGFVRLFHDDDIDDLSEDLLGSPSFIRMVSRDGCSPGKARERMRALVKETLAYPESPRHGTWKPEKNEKCNWKLRSGDKVNLLFFYDWLCRNAGGEE